MSNIKFILIICFSSLMMSLNATVRLPHLFSDHMVIQRDQPAKVWGWAGKNETVLVTINNQTKKVKADKYGSWTLSFDKIPIGGPYSMEIEGKDNRICLEDIYVGDVWLCSGQSNMEMPIHGWGSVDNYQEVIKNAGYHLIRTFNVSKAMDVSPKSDCDGVWTVCSPKSVANFSAVAYFFAQKLNNELNIPIGIINSSWGGTEIESWIATDAYQNLSNHFKKKYEDIKITNFDRFVKQNEVNKNLYMAAMNNDPGMSEKWYNPSTDVSSWRKMKIPQVWENILGNIDGIVWFRRTFTLSEEDNGSHAMIQLGPIDDDDVLWVNGVKVGETRGYATNRLYEIPSGLLKEGENTIVVKITDYSGGGGIYGNADDLQVKTAKRQYSLAGEWLYKASVTNKLFNYVAISPNMYYGLLYNAMINPLTQFPIKGAIWYQGESNVAEAYDYRTLFPLMINTWREKWREQFPFYWVQLANYMAKDKTPQKSEWAELREAQTMALSLPLTGQAVITDIGEGDNLHPRNKQDVGLRLAFIALNKTYGMDNFVYSGPVFKSMKVLGNNICIEYDHIGQGLFVKNKYGFVEGFSVAGVDRKFEWAQAYVYGNKVFLYSNHVAHPIAVRYSWSNNPDVNLFNRDGLPAAPFRTDQWDDNDSKPYK